MKISLLFVGTAASVISVLMTSATTQAASITFPVLGESSFIDDYNADRSNGKHHATDIIASKNQPIVSATDGVIVDVNYPDPGWGYAVIIRSTAGNYFWYLHINGIYT